MNTPNRTATKSAVRVFPDAVEAGSAQVEQAFEKMSAAAADATNLINDSYSTAARRAQEYNAKFIEFAQTNTEAALAFVQDLTKVKTPTEFFELSTNHSRKQFETFTGQVRELATLAQKVASATTERIETDVNKAYNPS
jgi:phasin